MPSKILHALWFNQTKSGTVVIRAGVVPLYGGTQKGEYRRLACELSLGGTRLAAWAHQLVQRCSHRLQQVCRVLLLPCLRSLLAA